MMPSRRRRYIWFYDHVHSRYYDLAMKWCFLPLGGERKVRGVLLDVIDLRPADRVLDMCCGSGNTTFAIAERLARQSSIEAIDISRGQIERARERNRFPNVAFSVMDAGQTLYHESAFDKVIVSHALHEMYSEERLKVLQEARRVLSPGGTLAVLELDSPPRPFERLLAGFWFLYWLPFNFETPTRRDMLCRGLINEIHLAGFRHVCKSSFCRGVLQVVQGRK